MLVMKFKSKTIFNHFLLSITFKIKFEDLNLIFYMWVFNIIIKVIMERIKSNLNNTLLQLLGVWPKNYGFSIPEHFFVYLTKRHLHSSTTLNMKFSFTYYLELCNLVSIYCISHILSKNVKLIVWTL